MKISFIIPVYNVEQYLETCIKSILYQNYNNIELILVNDGSSDRSPQICDYYAKKDDRVKIIHKKNGGLSSARNAGLDSADGDYICFLDSDDFWIADQLNGIVERLNKTNCDLLMFPIVSYYDSINKFLPFSEELDINSEKSEVALTKILKHNYQFGWVAVRYLIRKSIIKGKLYFIEGYLCEDVDFIFRLWNTSDSFTYFEHPVYAYRRQNNNSISHQASFKFSNDLLIMIKKNLDMFNEYKIGNELKNLLYLNFQDLIGVVLYFYSKYNKEQRKILKKQIKSLECVFSLDKEYFYCQSKKIRLVKILLKLIGISGTGFLWGLRRYLQKMLKGN